MHYAAVISTLALVVVTGEMTHFAPDEIVVGDPASHAALAARDAHGFETIAAFRKFGTDSARLELADAQATGRVLLVANGTPARLVRSGGPADAVQVEIAAGPYRGAVVYVANAQALR